MEATGIAPATRCLQGSVATKEHGPPGRSDGSGMKVKRWEGERWEGGKVWIVAHGQILNFLLFTFPLFTLPLGRSDLCREADERAGRDGIEPSKHEFWRLAAVPTRRRPFFWKLEWTDRQTGVAMSILRMKIGCEKRRRPGWFTLLLRARMVAHRLAD